MITTIATAACVLTMLNSPLVALGRTRVVYIIGVVNGSCDVLLNGVIAMREGQAAIAALIIPSAWASARRWSGSHGCPGMRCRKEQFRLDKAVMEQLLEEERDGGSVGCGR